VVIVEVASLVEVYERVIVADLMVVVVVGVKVEVGKED